MKDERRGRLAQGWVHTKAVYPTRAGKAWAIDGTPPSDGFLLTP